MVKTQKKVKSQLRKTRKVRKNNNGGARVKGAWVGLYNSAQEFSKIFRKK